MPVCEFCGKHFESGEQHICFGTYRLVQKKNDGKISNNEDNGNEDTVKIKINDEPSNNELIDVFSDISNGNIEGEGKFNEIENEREVIGREISDGKQRERKEGTINRKKWYLVGIGGAGCNLVDSVLARKYYLLNEGDKSGYLSRVWEMAIQDFKLFDTNTTGIISSFIAKTEKWNEAKILTYCQLGGKDGTVGGGCDRLEGERAMEQTINSENMSRFKLRREDIIKINESQAILLMHSTTKGTGCGASPVFAKYLKDKVLEDAKNKMVISFTVLPDEEEIDSGIVGGNAFIGIGKIVSTVDAVFLCDNQALFKIPFGNIERESLESRVPFMWKRNRHIVEFLEALSLQSSWANDEDPAGFDLMDAIHPARMSQEKHDHAPILVPALGSVGYSEKVDTQIIKSLFITTLMGGKLAQCDYKRAKGASFVIYGPKVAMDQLEELRGSGVNVVQIARSFLEVENKHKNISVFYTTRKHLKKLHMLGFLWNPPLKAVDMMEKRVDSCIDSTPALRDEPSVKEAVRLAREVHRDLGYFFRDD
jgi:hypothetical protein